MSDNILKPCPWGHEAIIVRPEEKYYSVGCTIAGCMDTIGYFSTEKQAIEAWNTRPAAEKVKRLDEVKKVISETLKPSCTCNDGGGIICVGCFYQNVLAKAIVAKFGVPDNGLVEMNKEKILHKYNKDGWEFGEDFIDWICKTFGTKPPKPVEWPKEKVIPDWEYPTRAQMTEIGMVHGFNEARKLCIQAEAKARKVE